MTVTSPFNPEPSSSLDIPVQDIEPSSIEQCPACGTPVDASEAEPLSRAACPVCGAPMILGRFISHYELVEEVGRGGMGVVYKALDTTLGRNVALKILRKDHSENAELISQLETEAAITASINHPHVVRVFSTGTFEGRFYIAMELVDKGTLDDLITLQGSVAEAQVLDVAIQISQGLRAAYQHGLIHRDVKPGNILFADAQTAKIVDFGLATIEQADAATSGEIWGTPYYVAPEKLDQKPEDFRSDMYSLGATLFHALAGRPPFEAPDATMVALKHLKSEAVSLQAFAPHVSGSTAYVINRTLNKDPDKRYQSYDEFLEHLEYARRELSEHASKPKAKQRLVLETEQDQKLWSYVTFGMLGLLLIVGLGAWWFMQKGKRDAQASSSVMATSIAPKSSEGRSFDAARASLAKGDFAEAAKRFQSIAADSKAPEPLRHWSYAHAGLAYLFTGKLSDARAEFESLRRLNAPSGENASLAKFFTSLADKVVAPGAVPTAEMRDFDRDTSGAFAMLVLGLKNWELAEFDEAALWLRGVQSTHPSGSFAWIAEYKPLITDQLADLTAYRGAVELAKGATDAETIQVALDAVTQARNELVNKGPLAVKLDGVIAELQSRAPAKPLPEAEQPGALQEAAAKASELAGKWDFAAARKELSDALLTSPSLVAQRDLLATKLGWLENAKEALIAAVPTAGRSGALTKKDGSALGTVAKATPEGLETTGGGNVPWEDVAPAGLIAVLGAPGSPELEWSAGILAAWSGDVDAARKHLAGAARRNRQHLDALSAVWPGLRMSSENLALRKTAIATHATIPSEAADKAVDGNPRTSWSSDRAGVKSLQIDLGAPQVITRWVVKHARNSGTAAEANATTFSLDASVDGKTWAALDGVKDNVADVTNRAIIPTQVRYLRLHIHEPSFQNYSAAARVPEFELYGGTIDTGAATAFLRTDASPILPSLDVLGINLADPQQLGTAGFNAANGDWEIKMASHDIWDNADSFVYLYQPLNGDGEIVMYAASIEAIDPFTKLGVMFRETLTAGSRHALICLTPENGFCFQARQDPDGISTSIQEPAGVPGWMKLVRSGNSITGFFSTDGITWKQLGEPTELNLPKQIFVGVATTSHHAEKNADFKFSNVRITEKKSN